jgi:hypothetical protein
MREIIEGSVADEGGLMTGGSATTDTRPVPRPGPDGGSEDRPGSARRPGRGGRVSRRAAVVVTLAVLVVVAVLWARDGGGGEEGVSAPTTWASEAPAATDERPASPPPAATATTPGESPARAAATGPTGGTDAAAVLVDGRHPVFFTGFDVAGSTVEFDLVQYLTGDEARAYAEEHEDEYGEEYYDQYIVNENPRLRSLPVAGDVQITVLQTAESTSSPHAITFGELPGYVGTDHGPAVTHLGYNAFWLTVRDGTVVAIDEQYSA